MPKKKKPDASKEKIMPVIEEVVEDNAASEEENLIPEAQTDKEELQQSKTKSVKANNFNFKLLLLVTIITATVTGLLAGGFYVYFTGISKLQPKSEDELNYPTPVAVVTPAPVSSPSVTEEEGSVEENIDVGLYKIQVLNGSGRIGEASKAEKILVADDFNVVGVGNASRYDYEQTVVAYKKDVPPVVISNLKDLLSKAYEMSAEDGDNLPESGAYDIVVTVGSK